MSLSPLLRGSSPPAYSTDRTYNAILHLNMGEIMVDDPPPSYSALNEIACHKTASELVIEQATAFFKEPPLPPESQYLVRADNDPTRWKLLARPAMSNAQTTQNPCPSRKRRYRVVYPPEYEDVYLHKSLWMAHAEALPRYHVELYGNNRYEPEPVVILGPVDHEDNRTNEAMRLAMTNTASVIARIRDEVTQVSRFTSFCEGEFYSWDWSCKTAAARHDMQSFITRARKDCHRTAVLVEKLERFLEFVGQVVSHTEGLEEMRKSLDAASIRLIRLRL